MIWYHSYQGRKVVGSVYSLGASLVILGALFKILHLQVQPNAYVRYVYRVIVICNRCIRRAV